MPSTPRPIPIDWNEMIRWVRVGGVEQGVLDVESGRIVCRLLTDNSWESPDVEEAVLANPGRFVDLPHPSTRERNVWRARFAKQHAALADAPTDDPTRFDKLLRTKQLTEAWRDFERAVIVTLLREWFQRQGLTPSPARPPSGSSSARRARAR